MLSEVVPLSGAALVRCVSETARIKYSEPELPS